MNYVPVLKLRTAEMLALSVTPRDSLQPLLELMPLIPDRRPDLDEDQEAKPGKTLEEHLLAQLRLLTANWGTEPVMLDFRHVLREHSKSISDIEQWCTDALSEGVRIIPVLSLHARAAHINLVRQIVEQHQSGCALRITGSPSEWDDLVIEAQAMQRLMEIEADEIDLVIDLGPVHRLSISELSREIKEQLPPLLQKMAWRSTTLASSGFPDKNPAGDDESIARSDVQLWRQVGKMLPDFQLQFGDYGVDSADFGLGQSFHTLSVLLKYTTDDHWWFLRERGIKGQKLANGDKSPGQKGDFRELCKQLVSDPRYMAPAFSWGDDWLNERASAINSGSAVARRQAMFSHHFMVALNEVTNSSNVPAGPTTPADDELPF